MTKVLVTDSSLLDIADAIRAKNGLQTTYKPSEMAAAIEAIEVQENDDNVLLTSKCDFEINGIQSTSRQTGDIQPGIKLVRKSSGNTGIGIISTQKYDVTDYNNLCVDLLCTLSGDSSGYEMRFGLTSSKPSSGTYYIEFSPSKTVYSSNNRQTLKLDISSVSGEKYVGFSGFGIDADIYSVYFETVSE